MTLMWVMSHMTSPELSHGVLKVASMELKTLIEFISFETENFKFIGETAEHSQMQA